MDPKNSQEAEAFHRELRRKSLDSIRVYNPTDKDFVIVWDKFKHIIPNKNKDIGHGKGQKVVPRYLAQKYAKEIKNYIINNMAEDKVKQLMERASDDAKIKYEADPYERQKLYELAPRTDNPELIKEIFDKVILGVEEEYGLSSEESEAPSDGKVDSRTIEEQVMDSMNRKYVPNEVKTEPVITEKPSEPPPAEVKKYPINRKNNLMKGVSA